MPAVFLFKYTLDNGVFINVELDQERGTAGTFPPGVNSNGPPYPIHGRFLKLRGVYGKTAPGAPVPKRMFLPCPTAAKMESVYASGGFSVGSTTYLVTGKRGEHDTTTTPGS